MDFWKVYCLHNSYGIFLIFKAYKKKTKNIFFIVVLPLYIKMLTGYYQENKKSFIKGS